MLFVEYLLRKLVTVWSGVTSIGIASPTIGFRRIRPRPRSRPPRRLFENSGMVRVPARSTSLDLVADAAMKFSSAIRAVRGSAEETGDSPTR
jgi:hypothetical protein